MAAPADLQITPSELKFRFELRKNIPVTLSLYNPTSEKAAFKVKTTSPKKYCVRPSSGIVEPGSTKDVQVIMQAQREYPANLGDCKDKFLVQCARVGPEVKDVSPDLFDSAKNKDIKQTKLRVVLVGPPKPPSPVPEGVEEEASPARHPFKEDARAVTQGDDLASVTHERNKLKQQLAHTEKDFAKLKKQLDRLEEQNQGKPIQAAARSKLGGGFSIIHLLLVAIIALLLGHFLT
ncbi:hypothetical protein WJX72_011816 [[Myrmecia] bisecta]|uniref:MSP domain-containing protein n=1 Tax=[Myrmecia] bisecta TaxID=41462 RepID=A0AAW1P7G3_9CHLO